MLYIVRDDARSTIYFGWYKDTYSVVTAVMRTLCATLNRIMSPIRLPIIRHKRPIRSLHSTSQTNHRALPCLTSHQQRSNVCQWRAEKNRVSINYNYIARITRQTDRQSTNQRPHYRSRDAHRPIGECHFADVSRELVMSWRESEPGVIRRVHTMLPDLIGRWRAVLCSDWQKRVIL